LTPSGSRGKLRTPSSGLNHLQFAARRTSATSRIQAGVGWAAPERLPVSSMGSTSTGNGRAQKGTPATSFARRTRRTTRCCSASSRSSSTPTGRRRTRTTCQTSSGTAPGTWEAGVEDYKVAKQFLTSGYTRYQDNQAGAAWLFNGKTFWTFDDPPVMAAKADYVRRNRLGGIMFWELSGDTPNGELISAIAGSLP
jgi:Glycosyl hydrolases family 18